MKFVGSGGCIVKGNKELMTQNHHFWSGAGIGLIPNAVSKFSRDFSTCTADADFNLMIQTAALQSGILQYKYSEIL